VSGKVNCPPFVLSAGKKEAQRVGVAFIATSGVSENSHVHVHNPHCLLFYECHQRIFLSSVHPAFLDPILVILTVGIYNLNPCRALSSVAWKCARPRLATTSTPWTSCSRPDSWMRPLVVSWVEIPGVCSRLDKIAMRYWNTSRESACAGCQNVAEVVW